MASIGIDESRAGVKPGLAEFGHGGHRVSSGAGGGRTVAGAYGCREPTGGGAPGKATSRSRMVLFGSRGWARRTCRGPRARPPAQLTTSSPPRCWSGTKRSDLRRHRGRGAGHAHRGRVSADGPAPAWLAVPAGRRPAFCGGRHEAALPTASAAVGRSHGAERNTGPSRPASPRGAAVMGPRSAPIRQFAGGNVPETFGLGSGR